MYIGSDDEECVANLKFKEDSYSELNSSDDDEKVTPVSTNPFLSLPTTSMGRGIPANYMDADDESQVKLIIEAKNDHFAQFINARYDDDRNEAPNNYEGFLNNNPFYINPKRRLSDLEHAAKNKFIYNDLKKVYGVNESFNAESEITELLRSCNIYSAPKSHLNSNNTLKVPNVTDSKFKSKVPLITDDNFFKFNDTLPTVTETFETEYLEAKYKCPKPNSSSYLSTTSESPNSSACSNSSSSSLSSTSSEAAEIKGQEPKALTAKDIYFMKRNKKRGTPILSTATINFKV